MTDEKELQPGLVIAARYRIVKRVGAGGMGSVYLVQHVHTEERFALKVLHKAVISDSNALERFRREARTPARIDSEYVVRVTDADAAAELGGAPFLVMEYLRGEDIDQRIERAGAFSAGSTVNLLKQAAKALDKAHSLGIVHRDLKPENLFVVEREDGTHIIKVLDFGIAKFTASAEDHKISQATRPGAVFGTPLFMSPEQAIDSSKVSSLTDIWALGLIAYRMLTAHDYWTAQTLTQLIAQIAYEPMVAPSERGSTLGLEFDRWFLKCCARKPDERYATAGEAIRELSAVLGLSDVAVDASVRVPISSVLGPVSAKTTDVNVLSDTQVATTQTPPGERSRGGVLGIVAVVGVAAMVAGFFLVRGGTSSHPDGSKVPAGTLSSPARASASAEQPSVTPSQDVSALPVVMPVPSASADAPPPAESAQPVAEVASSAPKPTGVGGGSGKPPPHPPSTPGTSSAKPPSSAPKPAGSDPFGTRF